MLMQPTRLPLQRNPSRVFLFSVATVLRAVTSALAEVEFFNREWTRIEGKEATTDYADDADSARYPPRRTLSYRQACLPRRRAANAGRVYFDLA
jgi:hypothetical protein